MNKGDLIDKMAATARISKVQATHALNALVDGVTFALEKGDRVTLEGFGTFSMSQRKARTGRGYRCRTPLKIASRRVAKFTAGSELKSLLSRRRGTVQAWQSALERNLVA